MRQNITHPRNTIIRHLATTMNIIMFTITTAAITMAG
jgi:hypothetical protein